MDESDKSLGERLKQLRDGRDMTLKDLQEVVGLTEATLSRYEKGIMSPKRTTIKVLAEFFGVNPLWLMGIENADKFPEDKPGFSYKKVPFLGTIAAGAPMLACESIGEYECTEQNENVDFCLKVKGDSMINARILDGDIVFIRKQPDVENGEIAAVIIDGEEVTLKRVYKVNGTVVLRAENPQYKDLIYSKKDMKSVQILGKAISFKSEVR